ncbi:MAG: histidine phosphatase family protein [Acidimicrobiales bacterium]
MRPSMESIPLTPQQVILIRHGATQWSKSGQHTGRTDLPLLEEGETEARALRGKLSSLLDGVEPAMVLMSPLRRAVETCLLAGYGEQAQVDQDLLEWDYGLYEGRTTVEIEAERSGWELFRDGCPGGEVVGEVARRASRVIARLQSNHLCSERPALVFAHGHVLRVLTAVWAGLGPEHGRALPFETGAVGMLGWSHHDPAILGWNL